MYGRIGDLDQANRERDRGAREATGDPVPIPALEVGEKGVADRATVPEPVGQHPGDLTGAGRRLAENGSGLAQPGQHARTAVARDGGGDPR